MYSLPYGISSLEFPDIWSGRADVLSPGPFPDSDPDTIVEAALDEPLGLEKFEDRYREGDRIACVIPDLTRRASVRKYLPLLLKRLDNAGARPHDVTIVVALGIHRPLTNPELADLVGLKILKNYSVQNNDADDRKSNVHIGTTDAGIPVNINRVVAEADHVILTGGIAFHYFAGYGGGRKLLMPGVASRVACEAHHRLVVAWRRGQLEGVLEPGVLEGNPAHEQMVQACSFLRSVFVLNVITAPGGRIIAATAGDLEKAHVEACRLHDKWFLIEVDARFDLVLAGSGGFPKDVNFVQAHKSLYAAHRTVSGTGVLILAAQCTEGTGHPDLVRWFEKCRTRDQWLEALEAGYQINGQTAFSTWLRVTSVPTILVSSLRRPDVEKMGMIPAQNMAEALKEAKGILGELPAPLILPDAGDILPAVKKV
jgi:nickel-dependent lactate racemase